MLWALAMRVWTLKIDMATRLFLGLSDRRNGTFLKSPGRHDTFLKSIFDTATLPFLMIDTHPPPSYGSGPCGISTGLFSFSFLVFFLRKESFMGIFWRGHKLGFTGCRCRGGEVGVTPTPPPPNPWICFRICKEIHFL